MNEMERQLIDLAAERGSGSGIASSVNSSELHPEQARTGQLQHPLKHQRTVLVRDIFWTRTRGQRMVGTQESGVNRQSTLCLERGRLGFLEEAAVAHLGPSKRRSHTIQASVNGDPIPAHSCCREGLSRTRSRNGHRRRLGT